MKRVVTRLEDRIRQSYPTSNLLRNEMWGKFRKRFINLIKLHDEPGNDEEITTVVSGWEGFILGFLSGEGFSTKDVLSELGGKWKEDVDDIAMEMAVKG